MSLSDGLDPYNFRRMMEKTLSVTEEVNGTVFFSSQIRHISSVIIMIIVLIPTLYLDWRVNNYVSLQGKSIK